MFNRSPTKVIEAIDHQEKETLPYRTTRPSINWSATAAELRHICHTAKDLWNRLQKAKQAHDPKRWSELQVEFDAMIPPRAKQDKRQRSAFPAIEKTNISHEQTG